MKRIEPTVLLDGLGRHPAYLAWRAVTTTARPPATIEILRPEKRQSAVYRLTGLTKGPGSVIAKRRPRGQLAGETRLYAELYPASVAVLEVYGYIESLDGDSWLFLEDAGDTWYERDSAAHRALAVEWLAHLHRSMSPAAEWLEDTGAPYFRRVLEQTRSDLLASLGHDALRPGDRDVLAGILCSCSSVEAAWDRVEQVCAPMPSTLVHGDFVPKNVRVRRRRRGGLELVAFDWETAGAAPPAVDLSMVRGIEQLQSLYLSIVGEAWPSLDEQDVLRLVRVGRLFRLLHEIHWETRSFAYEWIERAMRKMAVYAQQLRDVVADDLVTSS